MSGFTFSEQAPKTERENIVVKDKIYPATFKGYNVYQRTNKTTGEQEDRIAWTFEIQVKGGTKEIPGFTSTKWGWEEKPSVSRQWMAAMQGLKASDKGINRDLDAMIGKTCQVLTMTIGDEGNEKSIIKDVFAPEVDEDDEDVNF